MKVSKFFLSSIVSLVMVLVFSVQAHAQLTNLGTDTLGNRLIYDTDLDITWYDYSNALDSWQNQLDWASALSVTFGSIAYTDWRLPSQVNGPYVVGYDGTTTAGYNITSSEMGHLWYTELENIGYYATDGSSPQPGWGLTNTGDFQNLQDSTYWSGTEYTAHPDWSWGFGFRYGDQGVSDYLGYGIAVMNGMAVVPEPISSTLFIVGGATLGFRRFRNNLRNRFSYTKGES